MNTNPTRLKLIIFSIIGFIGFSVFCSYGAKAKVANTFASPDFAFPKTVSTNAETALKEAEKSGDNLKLIQALVQLTIASQQVSAQKMPEMATLIDSHASLCSGVPSAILYLLEAQLYNDVYEADSYTYKQRNLPLDSFPASPELWSEELFALKINSLVSKALSESSGLESIPIGQWAPLFTGLDGITGEFYPDIYSVLVSIANRILQNFSGNDRIIPFTTSGYTASPSGLCSATRQKLLDTSLAAARRNAEAGNAAWLTIVLPKAEADLDESDRITHLINAYNAYRSSPYAGEFLLSASDILSRTSTNRQEEIIKLLNEAIAAHPDYARVNALRTRLNSLSALSATVEMEERVIPGKKFTARVSKDKGSGELYLHIFKRSSSMIPTLSKALASGQGKWIASYPVSSDSCSIVCAPVAAGDYAAALSRSATDDRRQLILSSYPVTFTACGMTSFYTSSRSSTKGNRLYIVSAENGAPLKGVKVAFTRKAYHKPDHKSTATTNAEGWVEVPEAPAGYSDRNIEFKASHSGDTLTDNIFQYNYTTSQPRINAGIFPSLSIYKPGTDCGFAIVTSREGEGVNEIAPRIPLSVRLLNASSEVVDSLTLTSDDSGRVEGLFHLPKSGMLGEYQIVANLAESKNQFAGIAGIRVEEYRRPGFFVELQSDRKYYSLNEDITLSGKALSYSGMPMAGTEVKIGITYRQPWWRYYSSVQGSYSAKVTTDGSGAFSITLPTASLKDTPYATGSFEVVAEATSAAGETQKSEPAIFSLGNLASVIIKTPSLMRVDTDSVRFAVEVSGSPRTPEIIYTLKDKSGVTVSAGEFPMKGLSLPASLLPSGLYTLDVVLRGNDKANAAKQFTLYRPADKCPPTETILWIPETEFEAEPGQKSVSIPIGSSFPGQHIIYAVSDTRDILIRKEIIIDAANTRIEVPAPAQGSMTYVRFFAARNGEVTTHEVTVAPPSREIKMETISFRDKISAGDSERWIFRYTGANTSAVSIPVIATLSDKALNAIAPFRWSWRSYLTLGTGMYTSARSFGTDRNTFLLSASPSLTYPGISVPEFFTYGQSLYPFMTDRVMMKEYAAPTAANGGSIRIRGYAASKRAMLTGSVQEESAEVAADDLEMEAGAADSQPKSEPGQFRPAEMPLAWFKPMLSTDGSGLLEITFDAPDYNTTWQLQLLAYNPELISCNSILSTIASKPVMAQASAPRFLRTGDKAVLPATLFNNTDSPAEIEGEITLFNPLTEETILSQHFAAEMVGPGGNRVLYLGFTVPDDVEYIGYKVMARSGNYSDGEQSLIGILPSSSPVIETYPFYIAPGQRVFSMTLPELKQGNATLQYCDNPVWYCVTALPSLTLNTDASVLSLANSIYGNAIALGLTNRYPQISEAISAWSASGDSTLVSSLERNPELKAIALASTPWVSNASAETLRMQQLSQLLDSGNAAHEIDRALAELLKRQNGGWSWCEGMQPSAYITGQVLWRLAMLHHMDYAPKVPGLAKAEKEAIAYVEKEIWKEYKKDKEYPAGNLLGWFYVRSFFKDIPASAAMAAIKKKALAEIRKSWKSYPLYDAATAATLLSREGYSMEAREILESLRQKASESRERGMWYNNLQAGWNGMNTLVTTSQVLEAYSEILPSSPCIDSLRQWLLIERQAQDWGTNAQLAEVVWSILSSGSVWTDSSAPASVMLNGTPLAVNAIDRLTGALTIQLDPVAASGAKLSITREGAGPAWGGIATRYIAPISSIRDFSESDVTVTKRLLKVVENASGTHTEELKGQALKPGDKVRVQLTVTSARDIDYTVITDEQAGCLTPTDQLSGYIRGEVPYYREVRTGVTNLFIPRLPKGKFLIEYDCYAEGDGIYALGIATLQSLYAPMLSAHSAGETVTVTR